jgi:hypothetical protein
LMQPGENQITVRLWDRCGMREGTEPVYLSGAAEPPTAPQSAPVQVPGLSPGR